MSFVSLEKFQLLSHYEQYYEIIKMLKYIDRHKKDLIPEKLDKVIIGLYLVIEDIGYKNITPDNMLGLYGALINTINDVSESDIDPMFTKLQYIQIVKNKKIRKVGSIFNF